ncbi:hypothetical protein N7478_001347 [Penicillium angulare]|uniref:uncharacterized protein n=1 Tax=Penicillium angulare TaxID=116970 RepID=UPI00253FE304|nr:uncharacterized protein N7478_001347 [Penicillium angulare]KAJ5292096.1 hypothetical protein N7478_001347 [Penicillium angulare]
MLCAWQEAIGVREVQTPSIVYPLSNPNVKNFGGMAHNPSVDLTGPLDNLVTELNDLFGPGPRFASSPRYLPFIQELPAHIPTEKIQFLQAKGAFEVPDQAFATELIRSFIDNVYPFLPVIDLEAFLTAFCYNGTFGKTSLLLFHAVMFSSAAFVDYEHLRRAGYRSRKEIREDLFLKTRALYDFDYENDRFVLIQALLLMSYWHETPDSPKNCQYWLHICCSFSSSIGLQDPIKQEMDFDHGKIRNASGGFQENNFELLPLVDFEDFEIREYPDKVRNTFKGCEFLWNVSFQEYLASTFIEKAKLSLLISDVTALRDFHNRGSLFFENFQGDEPTYEWKEKFKKTLEKLHEWRASTPSDFEPPILSNDSHMQSNMPHVHVLWVRIVFLATLATLHRQDEDISPPVEKGPERRSRQILSEMSTTMQDLHRCGLIKLLPTTIVALMVPVLAMHYEDIRSGYCSVQIIGFQNFYRCLTMLGSLGDTYSSANAALYFFENALDHTWSCHSPEKIPTFIQDLLTQRELEYLARVSDHQEWALAANASPCSSSSPQEPLFGVTVDKSDNLW